MELQSTADKIIAYVLSHTTVLSQVEKDLVLGLSRSRVMDEIAGYFSRTTLQERDIEIIEMLSEGHSSKDIGKQVNRSPRTVEARIGKLKDMLGCKNTAHLIKKSIKL